VTNEFTGPWRDIINLFAQYIGEHNPIVARQVSMAIDQSAVADSIEKFKQIGVTMRDSWIEYAQSIFRLEFLPTGVSEPGSTDAKRMIEYSLRRVTGDTEYLRKMVNTAYDLCNKLQHDTNATLEMALMCISSSVLCMGLVQLTMTRNELLTKRPYYKCPNCGSLKLEVREHWEADIDGAFRVDKLVCRDCGWFYIEEMGGMSGIEH
jgi:hypothetical protein